MVTEYLDSCCLNRPSDDPAQARIRLEAEAVMLILERVEAGLWMWLVGTAVLDEIEETPDPVRRARLLMLLAIPHRTVRLTPDIEARARSLAVMGFGALDALHLAFAEAGGADVLLTTDDQFLRTANRVAAELRVPVDNPLRWLQEMTT